jgi:anaphase-promoting complex subunit 3
MLRELEPKEPPIYFLLGKIYKKLDQPEKAIQHLTTALDLDSKNANFIKNAIEKLHHPEEEDDQELELT